MPSPKKVTGVCGEDNLKNLIADLRQGVALIEDYDAAGTSPISFGTGFLFNAELGYVLTNEHVIAEGVRHVVKFPFTSYPKEGFPAHVLTSGGQTFRQRHRNDW